MHRIMGSTDESTVEQLRELYLARVREVHPDTRDEDAPEIEIDEIKEIYDKLLERRVEQEETGYVDLTIEDYRAGVHHKKPKFHHYFYSNAMRFWIAIPVLTVLTEKSYDIATDVEGRKRRAIMEREEALYLQAIQEYRHEQKVEGRLLDIDIDLKSPETAV